MTWKVILVVCYVGQYCMPLPITDQGDIPTTGYNSHAECAVAKQRLEAKYRGKGAEIAKSECRETRVKKTGWKVATI